MGKPLESSMTFQYPLIQIIDFYGGCWEDPQPHIDSLADAFAIETLDDVQQIIIARYHLKAVAKDWWGAIEKKPDTFEQYCHKLLKTFWSDEKQENLLRDLINEQFSVNKGTTYDRFFLQQSAKFCSLSSFNFPESRIVRMVGHNMPREIRKLMIGRQISTIHEMMNFLEEVDNHFRSLDPSYGKDTPAPIINQMTNLISEKDNEGHQITHLCPIIEINVEESRVSALIDSGSQASIVSAAWIGNLKKRREIMQLPTRPIQMTLANGKKVSSENHQVWLEVEINKRLVGHTFLIMTGLIYDVVLGSDFLIQNHGIIDYPKGRCSFGKETVNFKTSLHREGNHESCLIQPVDLSMIDKKVEESIITEPDDTEQMREILKKYAIIFSPMPGEITGYTHRIRVKEETYIQSKTYPIPFQYKDEVEAQIKQMIEWNIVERSPSPYNNPLVVVKKKNGNLRLCLDARRLNSITIPERDAPPPIQEVLVRLAGKTVFSTLDLTASYWQLNLDPRDRKYTAFRYGGYTHVFKRVPFGLINSGAGLMRCLRQVLSEEVQKQMVCYVDDIVIISEDVKEHLQHLEMFLNECRMKNITVNLEKSRFAIGEITFLGHVINKHGIKVHPDKVAAIEKFPTPTTRKQIRSFLGLCNFYHKFYPNFAQETRNLIDLIKKNRKWEWTPLHDQELLNIKENFLRAVMLHHPDFSRTFYVQTDSSKQGLGAVLFQKGDSGEHQVIYFCSRALKGAEVHYTTTEQETLAIVWACQKFRQFLLGSEVVIITDHRCLEFLNKSFLTNDRLIRWSLVLQQFQYKIQYCPGPENVVADVLSRHPVQMSIQNPKINDQSLKIMVTKTLSPAEAELRNLAYWQGIQYHHIILELSKTQSKDKNLQSKYTHFRVKEGILQTKTGDYSAPWKTMVPDRLRPSLLRHIHQIIGHYGPRKTEEAVRRQFYWPGMYNQILTTIRQCDICAATKFPNKSYAGGMKPVMATRPNEILAIDHYGPLPKFRTFQYLLVTYDIFSKYVQIYPVRTTNSRNAIRALQDKQFSEVGKPETILSDHGSAFTSKEWKNWTKKQKVNHRMTSIRNPQSNPCERVMREISQLFRVCVPTDHRRWVDKLPYVMDCINNTMNESTGFAPTRLHYGQPCQAIFSSLLPKDETCINPITDQDMARKRLAQMAQRRIKRGRMQHYYFKVGDQVWLRSPRTSNAPKKEFKKFFPLYSGPYEIIKDCHDNAFLLKGKGIQGVYNARQLKPYVPPDPGKQQDIH